MRTLGRLGGIGRASSREVIVYDVSYDLIVSESFGMKRASGVIRAAQPGALMELIVSEGPYTLELTTGGSIRFVISGPAMEDGSMTVSGRVLGA